MGKNRCKITSVRSNAYSPGDSAAAVVNTMLDSVLVIAKLFCWLGVTCETNIDSELSSVLLYPTESTYTPEDPACC